MARLTHPSQQQTFNLSPQTLVGRSRTCDLRLAEAEASGQHALIRWVGNGWEIRDLSSRNGTHVDGSQLKNGERRLLKRGAQIGFGSPNSLWIFASDGPPLANAAHGNEEVLAEGGMLTLPPGMDVPEAVIFRDRTGCWVVERDGEVTPAGENIVVDGCSWSLNLPEIAKSTLHVGQSGLMSGELRFQVSADEETTHLSVTIGKNTRCLADRSHHYMLLCLARLRLEHRADGYSPEEEGWVDRELFADSLRIDSSHVNVQIHRARRQLAAAGIVDAAQIVERRSQAGQIRLGVKEIDIVRL